jgi:hypothetical protein
MLKVECGRISYPTIKYGDKTELIKDSKAQWNLGEQKFLSTKAEKLPYVILHDSDTNREDIAGLRQNFERQLRDRTVGQPELLEETDIKLGPVLKFTEQQFRQSLKRIAKYDPKLVVLILRKKDQEVLGGQSFWVPQYRHDRGQQQAQRQVGPYRT